MNIHRYLAGITTAAVAAGLTVAAPGSPSVAAAEPGAAETALTWQGNALATVPFSPAQALYLSFTSTAVDKAVRKSLKTTGSSRPPRSPGPRTTYSSSTSRPRPAPSTKLAESLATVPDGPAQDTGEAIGADAADAVIASRVDDGRGDSSIVYSAAGIGVWVDARPMATPWYGFVDRIVGGRPVAVDWAGPGRQPCLPDRPGRGPGRRPRRRGSREGGNRDVLQRPGLRAVPQRADRTPARPSAEPARDHDLFADLDRATAEAMRQNWRLKFTEGFWRPVAGITSDDGDPLTDPVPEWTSVLPVPPYPDYTSGHGALTGRLPRQCAATSVTSR